MSELALDSRGEALMSRLPVTGGRIDQQLTTQKRGTR
jgi:hypothetical protein